MKTRIFVFATIAVLAVLFVLFVNDAAAAHSLSTLVSGSGAEYIMAPIAAAALPESVQAELKRIREECHQPILELTSDVRAAQQTLAKLENQGFSYNVFGAGPTIGAQMTDGIDQEPAFRSLKDWNSGSFRMKQPAAIRAILTNEGSGTSSDSTTIPGQPDRRGIVGPVLRSLRLIDALPSRPVTSDSVEFVQLNCDDEAGEQILEGDAKAELGFSGSLQTASVATIAGHTTASKQVLADHSALQANIDRVIRHKVLSRLEHQLINGPGGQGRIHGLMAQSTTLVPSIATEPADVIGEAITRLANNGYSPGLVIMNPIDWFRIQLTKTPNEEEYVFGSPISPQAPGLWNTQFVTTPSIAEGKALILDTNFVTILDREQVSVLVSNTHADYFVRNLVKILGELRAGLEVADLQAVYQVDLDFPSSSS